MKPGSKCFTSQASFDAWFGDDSRVWVTELTFKFNPVTGNHEFDSTNYVPLTGKGCDNKNRFVKDSKRGRPASQGNGLFTSEIALFFRYNGGEVFDFRGDDSVWVFVDYKLALDIGGCHGPIAGKISLDSLNLNVGQQYALHIYHAEECVRCPQLRITGMLD